MAGGEATGVVVVVTGDQRLAVRAGAVGFNAFDQSPGVIVAVLLFPAIGAGLAGEAIHLVVSKAVHRAVAQGQLA